MQRFTQILGCIKRNRWTALYVILNLADLARNFSFRPILKLSQQFLYFFRIWRKKGLIKKNLCDATRTRSFEPEIDLKKNKFNPNQMLGRLIALSRNNFFRS